MCSVSPVDELHALGLGQTLVKIKYVYTKFVSAMEWEWAFMVRQKLRTRFIPAGPLVYELPLISVNISECTCFNPIATREVFQSIQYHEIRFFQIKMGDIER
jgi:hypothetical protein